MTAEPRILVLEDEEFAERVDSAATKLGFRDCILPMIQRGCGTGAVTVFWFRAPPTIYNDGRIDWQVETARDDALGAPVALRVTSAGIETLVDVQCPPLPEFDAVVLDCIMKYKGGREDKVAGINFCTAYVVPAKNRKKTQRVIILTQKRGSIELPYMPGVLVAWKDDPQPLQQLFAAMVHASIVKSRHGKVAVYDEGGILKDDGLSPAVRDVFVRIDTPITTVEDMHFLRGYLEIARVMTQDRLSCLRRLAAEYSAPIAFTWTKRIESGVQTFGLPYFDPVRWCERDGLILIQPTSEAAADWVLRLSRCRVLVGGREMAAVVRQIIQETRYLATDASEGVRPDPNKAFAILISGESRTGKSSLVPLIAAVSAETGANARLVRYSAPVDGPGLESALFGAGAVAAGAPAGGTTGLLGATSPHPDDGVVLMLDEAENLAKAEAIQNKFLDAIDSGEYRRWGEGETRYVRKAKIVLITMNDPKQFHPALLNRTRQVRMPGVNERRGDIPLLVRQFLYEMGRFGTALSTEAIEFLKSRDWSNRNVAALKAVLEKATDRSARDEISEADIREAWNALTARNGKTDGGPAEGTTDEAVIKSFATSGDVVEAAATVLASYKNFRVDKERMRDAANVVMQARRKTSGWKGLAAEIAKKAGGSAGAWEARRFRFCKVAEKVLGTPLGS